jgi:hypothetical protein
MRANDFTTIETLLVELKELVKSVDAPGDHPDTLRDIERLTSLISNQDISKDKCASLRSFARKFYACRSRRRWRLSEVDYIHDGMLGCISSIELHVEMMSQYRDRIPG